MVKRAVRTMLHTDEQWKRMGWGIVKLLGVQGK